MKEKILTFIIGALVGAIITAGGFLIYSKVNKNDQNNSQMGGNPPEMMQGENGFKGGRPGNLDGENQAEEQTTDENGNQTTNKKSRQKNGSNSQGSNQGNNQGSEQGTPPEIPNGDNGPQESNGQKPNSTTESNT